MGTNKWGRIYFPPDIDDVVFRGALRLAVEEVRDRGNGVELDRLIRIELQLHGLTTPVRSQLRGMPDPIEKNEVPVIGLSRFFRPGLSVA